MAYAIMTDSDNGVHEVILRRDGRNKIIVTTNKSVTDEQMNDLYWTILVMTQTGKRLKDLVSQQ